MTIPKRRLWGTDLDVSVLSYGPMRMAISADDPRCAEHVSAMQAAIEGGVNFIHSSYEYNVRWLMHEVLKHHPARHDLHHVIKVPVPDWDDGRFNASKYEARIDEALRDLCCDRISLVQWMWRARPHDEQHRLPLLGECLDAVQETHARLRDKGKVAHLATFPYFPESASAAMAEPNISSLIAYYNLLELEMTPVIEDLAKGGPDGGGRGFIAIRPYFEGVLTDKYASYGDLPKNHRLKAEKYRPLFERRNAILQALPEIQQAGLTAFSLRFPLLAPNCASVVVGLNNEAQVQEALKIAEDVNEDEALSKRVSDIAANITL